MDMWCLDDAKLSKWNETGSMESISWYIDVAYSGGIYWDWASGGDNQEIER